MNSESKYDKNTYIGYLKIKKGGMKIISGDVDDKIINKRDKVIKHLKKVLSGGKSLKDKNIKKYFKALGGKFVRSDILGLQNEKESSIRNVDKLLKLAAKNNLKLPHILDTFKGSAPSLYKELETNIIGSGEIESDTKSNVSYKKGGYNRDYYNRNHNDRRNYYERNYNDNMYGGETISDLELNNLRREIFKLRNNLN
jgi:hypothetical protein